VVGFGLAALAGVLVLVVLQHLAEVVGGSGVVASEGEGGVGSVAGVPRIGAERRA
jgi:hypothetical protein